ncbi:GspH/FimT family pseudopilin [Polynucleobacter sp. AP-Nino-20-G2]|uniref:GspH/FimT family pseudopilin n=1 Tax=Polynucleobacter sp. AP-Nino-20-G2 TaxID=2576917 RepID=UPI00203A63D3|nr:GspH/FimT family pseudopilin [Polynucleobacter sp. AP-Nino-20-G2]QWE16904.1 GspH/FimT family pseudopilin [Polynucleobacter sp. AP-Nino-20-G2]
MNGMNEKQNQKEVKRLGNERGGSLLELMAVVLLVAIMAVMSMPALQHHMTTREIDTIARRFITHAQFARGQALTLGIPIQIAPITGNLWDEGWVVKNACTDKRASATCVERYWFSQGDIAPIYFKGGGKQFIDPHSSKRGILFNAAGAAKTGQGGFVANRLILGHEQDSSLERQLILGSGGRWRICDPQRDTKVCK